MQWSEVLNSQQKLGIIRHWSIMLLFYLLYYAAVLINLTYYAQNYAHSEYNNAYELLAKWHKSLLLFCI